MVSAVKEITVITGASGVLGKSFAKICASQGECLLLTGRNVEKLRTLKAELENEYQGVEIAIVEADLTKEAARDALLTKMQSAEVRVARLINAAGADIQKAFSLYTQEKIAFQCRVNFEAAVALSRAAIENRAERLEILNVSSVSGIYPMPYFAIYSATKGALTAFSVALREEMRGKNVCVTAVLPGAMPTRSDVKEQIKEQGLWGKLAAKAPDWVAEKSLRAVKKNKSRYIPGFWNKAMYVTTKCLPLSWKLRFIAKRWSKISKDAF